MSTRREKSFACAVVTGSGDAGKRTVYVRAWDPRSAGQVVREALLTSDIREPATIVVRDAKGRDAWRGVYDPTSIGMVDGQGDRA